MDIVPRWLLVRRWIVLRFAARIVGVGPADRPGVTDWRSEHGCASRLGFARFLVDTRRLTEWPSDLSSATTPLSSFLEPPWRRS